MGCHAFELSKAAGLDGLPAELFIPTLAVTAGLLLLLVWKSWESEPFPKEWNKKVIVKIPRFECDYWKGIGELPVAKIIDERKS